LPQAYVGAQKAPAPAPDTGREEIHQALVEGLLLVAVGVVLVTGRGLRTVEAEGVDRVGAVRRVAGIGVVCQQDAFRLAVHQCAEPVHRGRIVGRVEGRFAFWVQRNRIGREIVVERDVLLEDDDQVLDRRRSTGCAAILGKARPGEAGAEQAKPGPRYQAGSRQALTASSHRLSPKLPRI